MEWQWGRPKGFFSFFLSVYKKKSSVSKAYVVLTAKEDRLNQSTKIRAVGWLLDESGLGSGSQRYKMTSNNLDREKNGRR